MTKNQKIIISIISALVLFGAYIALDRRSKNSSDNINVNQNNSTTTQTVLSDGLVIDSQGSGNYKVERVPVNEGRETENIPMPDLNRPLKFNSSLNLSEEVKTALSQKVASLQDSLKKDPTSLSSWLDLGVYQKMAGDYEGALITWKYVSLTADKDYISYGNMGDLYAYYLKDNGMAEINYLKAIENAPLQAYLYVRLAEVYRNVFGNTEKAKAIVDKGLKAIPGDKTLTEYRATL